MCWTVCLLNFCYLPSAQNLRLGRRSLVSKRCSCADQKLLLSQRTVSFQSLQQRYLDLQRLALVAGGYKILGHVCSEYYSHIEQYLHVKCFVTIAPRSNGERQLFA